MRGLFRDCYGLHKVRLSQNGTSWGPALSIPPSISGTGSGTSAWVEFPSGLTGYIQFGVIISNASGSSESDGTIKVYYKK